MLAVDQLQRLHEAASNWVFPGLLIETKQAVRQEGETLFEFGEHLNCPARPNRQGQITYS
jgi:hypothetical protein